MDNLDQIPFETMAIPVRRFFIWHTIDPIRSNVYVYELNQADLARRRCMGMPIDPLPWPRNRYDRLILRRWDIASGVPIRSQQFAETILKAERIRAALEVGMIIKPAYERKFSDVVNPKNNRRAKRVDSR